MKYIEDAEKDEILKEVQRAMICENHFLFILQDHILNEEERKELERQAPFWNAYSKMKERTSQLAEDAGYTYHPIKNTDRERLHLPDTLTNWIIS